MFLIILAIALCIIVAINHAGKHHGYPALIWRFFSGHTWHGQPLTNAGWFRRADTVLHPTGRAIRWHHWPRGLRSLIRIGTVASLLAVTYGYRANRDATVLGLLAFACALIISAGFTVWLLMRLWNHNRTYVRPLHLALGNTLGVPPATSAGSWLTVPRNFHDGDTHVRINLPENFTGNTDNRRTIVDITCRKLGLPVDDVTAVFHLIGKPWLEIIPNPAPPDKVTIADAKKYLDSATDVNPFIGLGRANKPIHANLENDSPHILISAGSGAGKSVTTRTIAVQVLHHGGVLLVLDVKRHSHLWARGLPNVRYERDIRAIHESLLWLQAEIERRNRLADEQIQCDQDIDNLDVGPRIIVLAEEMNATIARLKAYWQEIKQSGDPNTSPAVTAFGEILFMGRAVKVNVLAVAQMLTTRTVGGPEARENMGTRILARYTANNWRMLVPEIWPMPRTKRKPGRVQVCMDSEAHETQVLFFQSPEAREYATNGKVSPFPSGPYNLTGSGTIGKPDMPPVSLTRQEVPETPKLTGLREACNNGILTITVGAARWARANDPEFPAVAGKHGQENLYDTTELQRWEVNRPRMKV